MSIHLRDIVVRVPDGPDTLTILDGASLDVADGEVVAVTGESGSGKSTLVAVAGLLRRPQEGSVRIDGTEAGPLGDRQRTHLRGDRIGLVFQTSNLFPSLTALEQVELVAHARGHLDGAARQRARVLLEAVGLGHRLGNRPAQLSGGERQRVGIARAMMNEPAVLLADEPTASLDPRRGREVMGLLVEQATQQGVATIVVSHDPSQLPATTRTLVLEGGRLHERSGTV